MCISSKVDLLWSQSRCSSPSTLELHATADLKQFKHTQYLWPKTACGLHAMTVSTIPPSTTGQNKCYRNIIPYKTLVISIMVGHFGCKHSCLIEKNFSITFILPSRLQDGAESLGIETTSCQCQYCGSLSTAVSVFLNGT